MQTSALSRQTTSAALSQAGNSLRKVQSPGMLLAAAALQGDRLMASIMSQVRQDCFVTVSTYQHLLHAMPLAISVADC